MKYILILLLALNTNKLLAAEAPDFVPVEKSVQRKQSSEPSKLQKSFVAETGLVMGEYALNEKSNEECLDGDLQTVDYGDELEIVLGARTFIVGLGKDKVEEVIYPDCKLTVQSSYKGSVINEVREEVCKKEKHTIKTNTLIEKNKISYNRKVYLDDKLTKEISCALKLVK